MPSRPVPFVIALTNSSSVQAPMPVCGSGVMFGASRSPNGVSIARPPARVVTAARQRVAGGAIADDGEITAALDLLEILLVDAGRARPHRRLSTARAAAPAVRTMIWCLTHGRAVPDF